MPEFLHVPVLKREVVESLEPRDAGRYVDGTLGGGGHAEAILEASGPTGRLLGCDRDEQALAAARMRLARFGNRVELRHGNYARLTEWIEEGSCDGVVLDLGVSSPQLDWPERGFGFQHRDADLDCRMDRSQPFTAADFLNEASEADLARVFWELGGEPRARRFARAVAEARRVRRFVTTGDLAGLAERVSPRGGRRVHPATRVFQAVRMHINDELASLRSGLAAAWAVLKPGGRVVVVTFHSLEVRAVKEFGQARARDYTFPGEVDVPELRCPHEPSLRWVHRKGIEPTREEIQLNPRARSAQLRVMEKIRH